MIAGLLDDGDDGKGLLDAARDLASAFTNQPRLKDLKLTSRRYSSYMLIYGARLLFVKKMDTP